MSPFFVAKGQDPLCHGRPNEFETQLNYIHEFLTSYKNSPKFSFFYNKVSHDDTNVIQFVDNTLVTFFQRLHDDKLMENSMIVMFGDHGTRFDGIRLTKQGKLEERLPLNVVIVPQRFAYNHPEFAVNLMNNQQRLITPYDYHATFQHILHILHGNQGPPFSSPMKYQYSIFEKIPITRTCENANVNEHHCICRKRTDISIKDPTVVEGVQAVIDYLNRIVDTDEHASKVCENLTLKKINYAEELEAFPGSIYQVQFETLPGPSVFEGTFRKNEDQSIEVIEHYSRVTSYNGGDCGVKDHIKRVCQCKKIVNKGV